MRGGGAARLGTVLPRVLQDLRLAETLDAHRAVIAWEETVGERLAEHARAVSIHRGVLLIEVESSVWMQELQFHKRRILERLAEACGHGVVRDLRCQLGTGPRKA